jgi:hypothetical protein
MLSLMVALAAFAGCGADDEREAPAPAPASGTELRLELRKEDGATPREVRLRCPGAECTRVEAMDPDALAPTAADVACTELYGGPQVARLTGTLDGRRVDARFSRVNGCEADRWDRVVAVLAPDFEAGAVP